MLDYQYTDFSQESETLHSRRELYLFAVELVPVNWFQILTCCFFIVFILLIIIYILKFVNTSQYDYAKNKATTEKESQGHYKPCKLGLQSEESAL